jgi:hypothetical protein
LRVVEDWRRWRLEQDGAIRQRGSTSGRGWRQLVALAGGGSRGVDGEKKWRRAAAAAFCSLKEEKLKK